jgi:hypothetical protein
MKEDFTQVKNPGLTANKETFRFPLKTSNNSLGFPVENGQKMLSEEKEVAVRNSKPDKTKKEPVLFLKSFSLYLADVASMIL